MYISVVIPAFNRPQALELTLQGLAEQTMPAERFEVIVVDDGSPDDGIQALTHRQWPYPLQVLRQPRGGPGVARNRGVQQSRADLLVFLDADMIPAPGLLEAYYQAYTRAPRAILMGRRLPWPEAFTSPFEQVFNYVSIGSLGPEQTPIEFYCLGSGNFSLARSTLDKLRGFDPALQMTEDTDLGYRAQQQGIALHYVPDAVGYHNHPKTLSELCALQYASAWWTAHLMHKHPAIAGQLPVYNEVEPIALGHDRAGLVFRKIARLLLATPPLPELMGWTVRRLERVTSSRQVLHSFYFKILTSYRLRGFRAGLRSLRRGQFRNV